MSRSLAFSVLAAGENEDKTLVDKAPRHLQSGAIGDLRGLPILPSL